LIHFYKREKQSQRFNKGKTGEVIFQEAA